MSISLRDHKMLWGRAGGHCALCRTPLATLSELGGSSVIGEEAHIVARSNEGPRGNSPLTPAQRDSYSNLILLCPTDHSRIDDIPNGPIEFPIERLLETKREHEKWIASQASFSAGNQLAEEQWASLIDELGERMQWDDWTRVTAGIFMADGPMMRRSVNEQWHETVRWIYGRVWPPGHDRLRQTIETLSWVMSDFLRTFDEHSKVFGHEREMLETVRFYKIDEWNPKRYHRLLRHYTEHVALLEDLALEITRYGNLIGHIVRAEIDPRFRFEEGLLLVRRGPNQFMMIETLRPEFTFDELPDEQPYRGPDHFRQVRFSRDIHIGRNGSADEDLMED